MRAHIFCLKSAILISENILVTFSQNYGPCCDGVYCLGVRQVPEEERHDHQCFNEPECEQICDFVDTQVWKHAMISEELIGA